MGSLPVMFVEVAQLLDLAIVDGGIDFGPMIRCPNVLEVVLEVLLADRAVRVFLVRLREELSLIAQVRSGCFSSRRP